VNICHDHVVKIDKLYGPWAVWPIRTRLDYQTEDWVIEQLHCREKDNADETFWVEMARFPAWPPTNTSCAD
jgi:hypothetical protein